MIDTQQISQAELAEWVGISPPYLSQLVNEHRYLSRNKALEIGEFIGVKPSRLFMTNGEELLRLLLVKYKTARRKRNHKGPGGKFSG